MVFSFEDASVTICPVRSEELHLLTVLRAASVVECDAPQCSGLARLKESKKK